MYVQKNKKNIFSNQNVSNYAHLNFRVHSRSNVLDLAKTSIRADLDGVHTDDAVSFTLCVSGMLVHDHDNGAILLVTESFYMLIILFSLLII